MNKREEYLARYKEFIENAEMMVGIDKAYEDCHAFIVKYGLPDLRQTLNEKAIKFLTDPIPDKDELRQEIIRHFESVRKFEKCEQLKSIPAYVNAAPEPEDLDKFSWGVSAIFGFDWNCELCWLELINYDWLFDEMRFLEDTKISGIQYCTILVNYYEEKNDFEKCARIQPVLDELLQEEKDNPGKPSGTKYWEDFGQRKSS